MKNKTQWVLMMALFIMIALSFSSCAESKRLQIEGETVLVHPYGWADHNSKQNDKVIYDVSVGNVIWSVVLVETVVAPVVLTGWYLFEPVDVKPEFKNNHKEPE